MTVKSKILEAKENLLKMDDRINNIYVPPAIIKIKYDRYAFTIMDHFMGLAMVFGFIMVGFALHR